MASSTPTAAFTPVEPGVVVALALWLVTFDNGQLTGVLSRGDLFFHEFFHDGRHIVGVPCH
jgi:Probable cobalt transporter subunit (CbtB)